MPNINMKGTPKLSMVGSVAHIVPVSGGDTWDFGLVSLVGNTRFGFGEILLEKIPNEVLSVINSPTLWKWTGTATVNGVPANVVLQKFGEEWGIRVVLTSAHGASSTTEKPTVVTATYEMISPEAQPEEEQPKEAEPKKKPKPKKAEPTPEEKEEQKKKVIGSVMVVAGVALLAYLLSR